MTSRGALFASVITVVLLSAFSIIGKTATSTSPYVVVLDGGSSGTKVMAFSIDTKDCKKTIENKLIQPTASTNERDMASLKVTPGISSFGDDMSGVDAYIDKVIEAAKGLLPAEYHTSTPIHMQCTAGMRLLSEEKQEAIMKAVRSAFRDPARCPFVLHQDDDVAVIKGKFEGTYDWLSANYLRSTLAGDSVARSAGTIDMGGASTEFTFMSKETPKAHRVSVSFPGVSSMTLYSYSWLRYGQNQALKSTLDSLASSSQADVFFNPCYLRDYTETFGERTVNGTGHMADCQSLAESVLIQPNATCAQAPCSIDGVYTPSTSELADMKFILVSSFDYTWNFFGLNKAATIGDLEAKTAEFCGMTWEEAVKAHPSEPEKFLKVYCFAGSYFSKFLQSLGFSTSDGRLRTVDKIGTADLDWPYGYLLVENCGKMG